VKFTNVYARAPAETNTTLIIPPLTNTTLTNSTTEFNTTSLESADTQPEPISEHILAYIQEMAQKRMQYMQQLFGEETYSQNIMNGLSHAEQAMNQAMNYQETNPTASTQHYLRAMKQYRNTLRYYLKENSEISEAFVASANSTETNTTASEGITLATSAEVEAAKIQLMEQFEERFRDQLEAMIQNIEDASDDMSPQDAYKAQHALIMTLEKLQRIQERIQNGQYDGALDDLDEATDGLDDELDTLEDKGAALMLKTVYRLEARIQKMEQRIARKAAMGLDVDEDSALLETMRGNKAGAMNEFKHNKDKGNNGKGKNNGNSQH
jgi:hypothetical protein